MGRLTIVSAGPGTPVYRLPEAEAAIRQSDVVLGRPSLLDTIDHPYRLPLTGSLQDMIQTVNDAREKHPRTTLLLSGDATFLSLTKHLALDEETEVVPGISSFQYFATRLRICWDQAALVSLHGHTDASKLLNLLETGQGGFIFPGGYWNLTRTLEFVSSYNQKLQGAIGIDLSLPGEIILKGSINELIKTIPPQQGLSIIYLYPGQINGSRYLKDGEFIRTNSPLSKEETRMIVAGVMRLAPGLQVLEIGAGSGGITVEIARRCPGGRITALERDENTVKTLQKNLENFQVTNVKIVNGHAPSAIPEGPYHRVFIGGSGGEIETILQKSFHVLVPGGILALTAITVPTLVQGLETMEKLGFINLQCIQQNISRLERTSRGRMFRALNPVCIMWGEKYE